MSSESIVIRAVDLGKRYQIYGQPVDRLWQFGIDRWNALFKRQLPPRHHSFTALQGLSLTLRRGETVGIIGRNGSGKSTLLQLLCGTLNPSEGVVETHGRVAALLELGSGFNPEFSGRENVLLYASVLGLTREQTLARFDDIVAFADIGDFLEQPVKTYSSGMAVRLAFAVIAHVDADILVVDEALAVGDAFFTQKCMRFLRNFMQQGTVLMVSHDTEAIKALCGRVVWLEGGRLIQDGPTKDVCQAYLNDLLVSHHEALRRAEAVDPAHRDESQRYVSAPLPAAAAGLTADCRVYFSPMPLVDAGASLGGATVRRVVIRDIRGIEVQGLAAGETASLDIEVAFDRSVASPLIGFMVKDRTGQALFGENTRMTQFSETHALKAGDCVRVTFSFELPHLQSGDYSTVVAVAEGSQAQHVHLQWIHDALHLRSDNGLSVHGLVGIPMLGIDVQVLRADVAL
jgi:lipopolysaccharide transport system ATP-binding protein